MASYEVADVDNVSFPSVILTFWLLRLLQEDSHIQNQYLKLSRCLPINLKRCRAFFKI